MAIPSRAAFGLVFAPLGRDAQIAASLLNEAGIACQCPTTLEAFVSALGEEVAFAVVTEEALRTPDLRPFAGWIAAQPSWSDLPVIVLIARGGGPERNPAAARLLELLGNVSFLERPFHATTFISVARTAMRARRRQYDAGLRMEALDEGERRLQTALEAGRLGTWELDVETEALSTSTSFRKIFGRRPNDDLTYRELLSAIHPDDTALFRGAVSQAISTGNDCIIACRTIWPDGTTHGVDVRARSDGGAHGRPSKLVGVAADITERLKAEEQQQLINSMLEEKVAERTRELQQAHEAVLEEVRQRERAEEQLRHAQKMEAIGQLTGGVAHDFNNLLMAVLGNLELLRKHCVGDLKATRLISGAEQGAQRGASLTQRLLAFARRQDLQVAPLDLAMLVTGMMDLLVRSVGSHVTIKLDVSKRLPFVLADKNQLELALLNLAVNARDAMPEGGTITIALREEAQTDKTASLCPGDYVVLAVVDEGSGMDPDTLQKAVDPFFSTKELGKGTGLGLSMVHGLALQLNGALRLTSKPGTGTTAELWLPATTTPSSEKDSNSSAFAGFETSPKRILLVDDDTLIAMASADMLTDLGHEVVEAYSGREALAALENETFDLLITDYSMPGMTGGELAKAAREAYPMLRILIATGYADLPAGIEVDAPRIAKPYNQEQLGLMIQKLI